MCSPLDVLHGFVATPHASGGRKIAQPDPYNISRNWTRARTDERGQLAALGSGLS